MILGLEEGWPLSSSLPQTRVVLPCLGTCMGEGPQCGGQRSGALGSCADALWRCCPYPRWSLLSFPLEALLSWEGFSAASLFFPTHQSPPLLSGSVTCG